MELLVVARAARLACGGETSDGRGALLHGRGDRNSAHGQRAREAMGSSAGKQEGERK
jgi:hypothetical protein